MSAPAAIEARGWGWRHPGRRGWALRGVDIRIEPGERVMLLGASGSGKSTLLSGLAGLLEGGDLEGELLVDGLDPRTARDRMGIVFQDPESSLVMARAGDEIAFGLENRCVPPSEIWPRVNQALEMVGFPYGRDRPTDALSGGEQQRLALAAALALDPGLLLFDEPTANLDPGGAALVRGAIGRVLAGGTKTMVLVEHRVAEAVDLVDRVIVLQGGAGVIADGPPAAVFAGLGDELASAGIWVPNHPLPRAPARPGPPREPMLVADQAGYRFPGERLLAVGPMDVELRSGEALAVVGPNGSGKSTLALLLGGLLRPSIGRVTGAEREPIWRWPARRLARRIGSVFQDPEHQFLTGRVREELSLAPPQPGPPSTQAGARAAELMERLHLAALAEANPFTLSGGEKRRLSVATALVGEPGVLILDEPTFGQDRRTAVELLDLLARQRDEGTAICFVTHDLPFAAALADRTLELAG
ncbi:MAG TPA: ATP-binding cassette domain-containing protein [Candidatus Limnocylindria bacterium]|nr:ATP-binding cassette domain-containing protein [Candidatus Limnocylindria bacterium]